MAHTYQATTFAVTEWPLAPASVSHYFNNRTQVQKTGNLLLFLADALAKAKQPLHSKVVFTLVNVTAIRSNMSYGYQPSPHPSIHNKFVLSFTFALTANKSYAEHRVSDSGKTRTMNALAPKKPPRFVRILDMYTRIWGRKANAKNEFITIRIPPEFFSTFKLNEPSITNLAYLYQIVGAFTKNFVRSPRWHINKDFHVDGTWSIAFSSRQPMADMFKEKSFPFWPYNPIVWKKAPNLIVEQHFSEDLYLYWCLFLNIKPIYGEVLSLFGRNGSMTEFVAKGVFEIVGNKPVLSKAGIAATYLYARVMGSPFDKSNPDAAATLFVRDFHRRLENLELKSEFTAFNADRFSIAVQLIDGKVNKLGEQPWTY